MSEAHPLGDFGRSLSGLDLEARRHAVKGVWELRDMPGFHTEEHHQGVRWSEAPLPFPIHRCRPWSSEWWALTQIQHCACGAARENIGRRWTGRNSRRRR